MDFPYAKAASMVSESLLDDAMLSPAVLTIALIPPVRPRLEVTMNEYMAGRSKSDDRAAMIRRIMMTVTKGVIASIGIP